MLSTAVVIGALKVNSQLNHGAVTPHQNYLAEEVLMMPPHYICFDQEIRAPDKTINRENFGVIFHGTS